MTQVAARVAAIAIVFIALAGCVSSPFGPAAKSASSLTPGDALSQPDRTGAEVVWGGRVIGIVNTDSHTELELVALPLGRDHRPRRNAEDGARFVIRHPGFLEPMNWAPGRFVTAYGRFSGMDMRPVGGVPLRHAVMTAEQIELWPVTPNSGFSDFGNLGRPPN